MTMRFNDFTSNEMVAIKPNHDMSNFKSPLERLRRIAESGIHQKEYIDGKSLKSSTSTPCSRLHGGLGIMKECQHKNTNTNIFFQCPVKKSIVPPTKSNMLWHTRNKKGLDSGIADRLVRWKRRSVDTDDDESCGDITERTDSSVSSDEKGDDFNNSEPESLKLVCIELSNGSKQNRELLVQVGNKFDVSSAEETSALSDNENSYHKSEEKEFLSKIKSKSVILTQDILGHENIMSLLPQPSLPNQEQVEDEEIQCFLDREDSVYGALDNTGMSIKSYDYDFIEKLLLGPSQSGSTTTTKEMVEDMNLVGSELQFTSSSGEDNYLYNDEVFFCYIGGDDDDYEDISLGESERNHDLYNKQGDKSSMLPLELMLTLAGVDSDLINTEVDSLERRSRLFFPFRSHEKSSCSFLFSCMWK